VPLSSGCLSRIFSQLQWADLVQAEFHESLFTAFLPLGGIPRLFVCHQAHGQFCERFDRTLRSLPHGHSPALSEMLLPWIRESDAQAASILESTLLRRFNRVITFTAEDRDALLRGDGDLPVAVSPFPFPADIRPIPPQEVQRWQQRLVFIGPGHWHPNVEALGWFCREVRPRLLEHWSPSCCTLHVFGRWSPRLVESLQGEGVEFHGFAGDPAQEIAGCIAVNPVFTGAGLRTKVLLAAACSAVLVSTTVGSEGTGFRSGEHCLLAETGPDFANAINQLLRSPGLCRSLAACAFETVLQRFSPEGVRQRRNAIYRSLQGEGAPE
jgi:glycosyltransferase involved in cell wall biosynthesis